MPIRQENLINVFSSAENNHNSILNFYTFLNPTKHFVDICKKKATFFSSDIQLMATTTSSFKECRCFINGGKFTITITDLRLRSKLGRNCSSSTLQIDSKDCDCSYPGYNDISSKTVKEDVSKTFISVSSANDDSSPMMVWLTLRPKGGYNTRPRGSKTFSMLNSAEILNTQYKNISIYISISITKYKNIKKFSKFQAQVNQECYFSCS